MTRVAGAAALAAAIVGVLLGTVSPAGAAGSAPAARRVLIVALPGATWRDVQRADAPALRGLLAQSGVAGMTLHGANDTPTLTDGYVTIGTGARAEGQPGDGDCAAEGAQIRCAGIAKIAKHNDHLLFDARVGLLGDTLRRAGVSRAVITGEGESSSAALALADRSGIVPAGTLGAGSVVDAFDNVWRDRSVVLVAPGDVRSADDTIGRLLQRVDPRRDAVLVVGPSQPPGAFQLTTAGLRAPGLEPGLLRSAYTRRAGTVALVDVAPTVLDQLGIKRPADMEGRAFEFGRTGGDFASRLDWLVDTNARAHFRDLAITQADGIWVGCAIALACAGILFLGRAHGRTRVAPALEVGALAMLFFPCTTYLAMLVPWAHRTLPNYWMFTVLLSAVAAAAAYFATARRSFVPVALALFAIIGLIVVDVVTGARLQFNGAFGYSPTIGGRYAGLGNLGFAQLAAATAFAAGLVAYYLPGRRGVRGAAALFALAIVIDGAPFFGADVGGVLAMVPAFGVTLAMLAGRRIRASLVVAVIAATVALVGLFAAVDLARPADRRTHLGRMLAGNSGDLTVVLRRKIDLNLSVLGSSPVTWLLPVVFIAFAYLVYRSPGPLGVMRRRVPTMTPALVGLGLVALLGTALNDSGLAITGVMFAIAVPVLVFMCSRAETREQTAPPMSLEVQRS